MKIKAGFSLIELMVTIAIVAILAAVAVPAYKTHKVRAQISSSVGILQPYIANVIAYYNKNGVFPDAGIAIPGSTYYWNTYPNQSGSTLNVSGSSVVEQIGYNGDPAMGFPANTAFFIKYYASFGSDPDNYLYFALVPDANGIIKVSCGNVVAGHFLNIEPAYMPSACTETDLLATY